MGGGGGGFLPSSVRRQWDLICLSASSSPAHHVVQFGLGHFLGAHLSSWWVILQSVFFGQVIGEFEPGREVILA